MIPARQLTPTGRRRRRKRRPRRSRLQTRFEQGFRMRWEASREWTRRNREFALISTWCMDVLTTPSWTTRLPSARRACTNASSVVGIMHCMTARRNADLRRNTTWPAYATMKSCASRFFVARAGWVKAFVDVDSKFSVSITRLAREFRFWSLTFCQFHKSRFWKGCFQSRTFYMCILHHRVEQPLLPGTSRWARRGMDHHL